MKKKSSKVTAAKMPKVPEKVNPAGKKGAPDMKMKGKKLRYC
jgi:hypothetical protein